MGASSSFHVRRAGIKQRRIPRGERKSQGIPQTLSSTSSPGRLTEHPSAGGGGSRASGTASASKSSGKTSSVRQRPARSEIRSEFASILFARLCPTAILHASELGRCAARPPLLAAAFLGAFRGVVVRLRVDDDRGSRPERRSQPWTSLRPQQIPASQEQLHSSSFALPTRFVRAGGEDGPPVWQCRGSRIRVILAGARGRRRPPAARP